MICGNAALLHALESPDESNGRKHKFSRSALRGFVIYSRIGGTRSREEPCKLVVCVFHETLLMISKCPSLRSAHG